jgi:hypothetical protein
MSPSSENKLPCRAGAAFLAFAMAREKAIGFERHKEPSADRDISLRCTEVGTSWVGETMSFEVDSGVEAIEPMLEQLD